jgi:hypothetical protein
MPAVATNGTAPATNMKRFELPALDFKFSSLTDGTDIPPPLPSPEPEELVKVPTPPKTPTEATTTSTPAANSPETTATTTTKTVSSGVKRPADPSSPTGSNRPGSIRRLFSRNLLHNAYEEGAAAAGDVDSIRPESRTNGSFVDASGQKSKRASGFFRRLRSRNSVEGVNTNNQTDSNGKRGSVMVSPTQSHNGDHPTMVPVTVLRKPAGPPPPMIPELSELKSKVDVDDGGSLGGDLFKDISMTD